MKKYIVILAVLAFVFVAGTAVSQSIKLSATKPGTVKTEILTEEQLAILAVRKIKPSVVSILGTGKEGYKIEQGMGGLNLVPQKTSGTGFIIEKDGLIVTNNHVISDTSLEYFVVFADGSEYRATVLGRDKFDDLALLKIDLKDLPAASLGNSDSLETGQTVFAIGNSLGRYQNSVTKGVVSGLSRDLTDPSISTYSTTHNWIQTDAAINLGNSGGPLVNLAGEVVGMNTLIDEAGSSLGFALPVNIVKDAVNQLKTFGKVSRPFVGIQYTSVDTKIQQKLGLPTKNGSLVQSVSDNGPAKQAGVKENDVIIKVGNFAIDYQNPLSTVIQKFQAGNQVVFKILRDGKEIEIQIILGEFK